MQTATNTPYVRQYNELGELIQQGSFRNDGSNRRTRKTPKSRAFSNKKGIQMMVSGRFAWIKSRQIVQGLAKGKVINHLVFKKPQK